MIRRAFLLGLAGLLWARDVLACTEVKHGPAPKFDAKTRGRFECSIAGYYTDTHDLIAAGVESWRWNSTRPTKQQAELLGLRTAFIDWFIGQYQIMGGSKDDALAQIQYVVDAVKNDTRCVITEHGQEQRPRRPMTPPHQEQEPA